MVPDDYEKLLLESDRAVILIVASILDKELRQLLESFFNQSARSRKVKSTELFENTAPLSSFSAKIKIAYLSGLLCRTCFEDLENIRKLRNMAAHDLGHISFLQRNVKALVEGLDCSMYVQSGQKTDLSKREEYDFEKDIEVEVTARQKGFVKYHKAIFVIGSTAILNYLSALKTRMDLLTSRAKDKDTSILGNALEVNALYDQLSMKRNAKRTK